jgi:hypothetical protein
MASGRRFPLEHDSGPPERAHPRDQSSTPSTCSRKADQKGEAAYLRPFLCTTSDTVSNVKVTGISQAE